MSVPLFRRVRTLSEKSSSESHFLRTQADGGIVLSELILVSARHTVVREGIKVLLRQCVRNAHIIESFDGAGLLSAANRWTSARMAFVELEMKLTTEGEVLEELSESCPNLPLVVLTKVATPDVLRRLAKIDSVCAVVPENASSRLVTDAIDAAMSSRKHPMPSVVVQSRQNPVLTPRQQDIHKLLQQGMSNKLIAAALNLSEGTVKNHVMDILRALKASNRTQAARLDLDSE